MKRPTLRNAVRSNRPLTSVALAAVRGGNDRREPPPDDEATIGIITIAPHG